LLVAVAGELWETPKGFSKPCGKAEGWWWWPAFHRAADPQPGEEGVQGEELKVPGPLFRYKKRKGAWPVVPLLSSLSLKK